MRCGLCVAVAVLMVVGLALTGYAAPVSLIGPPVSIGRDLPVYDRDGKPVPPSVARATGLAPVSLEGGKPQSIRISAAVMPSLKVNLSSTEIAWEIKKTGEFQTKAIDIAIGIDDNVIMDTNSEDADLCPQPVATMVVTGANNLEQPTITPLLTTTSVMPPYPRSLPTFYALAPTYAKGVPAEGNYLPAEKFNGGHAIRNLRTSLWNKLMVSDKTIDSRGYPAGKYQDEFTVTFVQAL